MGLFQVLLLALVAQLDRVSPSEGEGRGFESRRARHSFSAQTISLFEIF